MAAIVAQHKEDAFYLITEAYLLNYTLM